MRERKERSMRDRRGRDTGKRKERVVIEDSIDMAKDQ